MWCLFRIFFFFFKQKTAYEMRISDWSSEVCSSDLVGKQIVQSFGRRVWRLPDKRPRGWRAERTRRRAKASGDPDPGPGPRSRGDVLEGRFALADRKSTRLNSSH